MVDQILDLVVWQLNYLYATPNVAKLGIGTFVTELVAKMQSAVSGQTSPKWYLYSAHDVTLALVLAGFNSLEGTGWPPFVGHLIFELWEDQSGNFFVHLLYNDKEVVLPNCAALCPYKDFLQIASTIMMTQQQWRQECGQTQAISTDHASFEAPNDLAKYFC